MTAAVLKFGGTSVADADAIARAVAIVARERESSRVAPAVVVSALAGTTDRLVEAARLAEEADADAASAIVAELVERHVAVASRVTSGGRREALVAAVRRDLSGLIGLLRAQAVVREVSPRSLDAVMAAGELASSRIVASAIEEQGIPSVWYDARDLIVTDAVHTAATPDLDATAARLRDRMAGRIATGAIAVVGGFIGATPQGATTTLGRGGSDFSAAVVGAGLGARQIQIWTDVDGMMTADPRIVPHPKLVAQLSFAEASELAYFGAKVLHPSTILPAVARNIPVRILNSRQPHGAGTLIASTPSPRADALAAIACKRGITVVDVTSTRMLMAHGFLRRLFEVFERFRTAVDVVTTSEVSVSVTVDDTRRLDAVVDNLRSFAEVSCEPEMAILCAVGERLRGDASLFGRAVEAIGDIPLRLVSQAASRRNVTFVMRDADVARAMIRLHDAFFGKPARDEEAVPASVM